MMNISSFLLSGARAYLISKYLKFQKWDFYKFFISVSCEFTVEFFFRNLYIPDTSNLDLNNSQSAPRLLLENRCLDTRVKTRCHTPRGTTNFLLLNYVT